jgi:hypothetical protein
MKEIVARKRRIVPARVAAAVVDGVVPIIIVIGDGAVPAAIVRFQGVMRPANARISAGDNNVLSGESQGPYLRCVRIVNPGLDRFRTLRERRPVFDWAGLRQVIMDTRIAFYSCHVRPRRQGFG